MNGNSGLRRFQLNPTGVQATEVVKRKKPEMQKVKIKIVVESEKEIRDGVIEEEWLANMTMTEVMEQIIEAIKEIE